LRLRIFDDEARYLDRFGLLLLVTAIAVITLSLIDVGRSRDDLASAVAQLTVTIFVGATLLLALQASGVRPRFQLIANAVIGLGIVASLAIVVLQAVGISDPRDLGPRSIVWTVLSVFAPILVIRRVVQHRRATLQTLLGAVSAYLLIALAFNFSFLVISAFGGPFFGSEEPTTSFMYFSLVTLTTLGYGDLAAAEPIGRLMSTIEAVIGQVYLVTFVAMIVGLMVAQARHADADHD